MKIVQAYRCSHCPRPKLYVREVSARAHERGCIYGPDAKACATCIHWGGSVCDKNAFDPSRITPRNLQGLRVDCPEWEIGL